MRKVALRREGSRIIRKAREKRRNGIRVVDKKYRAWNRVPF